MKFYKGIDYICNSDQCLDRMQYRKLNINGNIIASPQPKVVLSDGRSSFSWGGFFIAKSIYKCL